MTSLPGSPFLARDAAGALTVDGVSVADLAREHATPLFVYSKAAMLHALAAYQRGFAGWMTPLFGPYVPSLALAFAFVALWWGIVWWMDRRGWRLKI